MAFDRLGQLAQSGGFVDGRSDHRVFEPLLGTDIAGYRLSRCDTDARLALGDFVADAPCDRAACRQRLTLGVLEVIGCTEPRQRGVALELVDEAVMTVDFLD